MVDIDYQSLYDFRLKYTPYWRGRLAEPVGIMIYDSCALLRGIHRPRRPTPFEYKLGQFGHDVIWTSVLACVLVSKAFRDVLVRNGFSGWSTYPVRVTDSEANRLRGYYGLSVTGRAGCIDFWRSRRIWHSPRADGKKLRYCLGKYFEADAWDGTDFCIPDRDVRIIVSKRVVDAVAHLNLPNVEFHQLKSRVWHHGDPSTA